MGTKGRILSAFPALVEARNGGADREKCHHGLRKRVRINDAGGAEAIFALFPFFYSELASAKCISKQREIEAFF